eukprot:TRINITY_DN22418_c0_g1_i3.p3 TRINITY_DN22418_c0_g1~~TRINITY_DN22418_c0_g1_i3.p3  ORF type:complete len:109 (+),score=33.01 TRINITY_DN22418_c0_g1_i3:146-472(+)
MCIRDRYQRRVHGEDGLAVDTLGTPYYMAPELHSSDYYTYRVDIWAFGVTLFYLAFGSFPFQTVKNESSIKAVSYTHLRAHETSLHLVCRLLLEKKKKNTTPSTYPRN